MTDVFTKAKRSEVMSRIRSRGNKETELALMAFFRRQGITGWRRHLTIKRSKTGERAFQVKPDFVFRKAKVAVFVDGCFWHACPKHCKTPVSNQLFWRNKLDGNKARDRKVNKELHAAGWRVIRFWHHKLSHQQNVKHRLERALTMPTNDTSGRTKKEQ